jgi:hypothetical protein
MKRTPTMRTPSEPFAVVAAVGLELPDVEAATRYDGSPALKVGGAFMAGLATHRSAKPGTLVVRVGFEEREWLLEDAPETYYVTDSSGSCGPAPRGRTCRTGIRRTRPAISVFNNGFGPEY